MPSAEDDKKSEAVESVGGEDEESTKAATNENDDSKVC